jgi:small subunit ribosomal protein S4
MERQFRRYYQQAAERRGMTGEELLKLLERRLDNTVYRLGFARTRPMARQLIVHGHIRVDDRKVDRPSFLVEKGQVVRLSDQAARRPDVLSLLEKETALPKWLERTATAGKVVSFPGREEIAEDVDESLVVEFYSR